MYIFLIFGAISLAWSVIFLLFMPDIPSKARFLSKEENVVAVERVAANRQGVKNHHFKKYQMWQTIKDPKTWILFVMSASQPRFRCCNQAARSADLLYRLPLRSRMLHNPAFVLFRESGWNRADNDSSPPSF